MSGVGTGSGSQEEDSAPAEGESPEEAPAPPEGASPEVSRNPESMQQVMELMLKVRNYEETIEEQRETLASIGHIATPHAKIFFRECFQVAYPEVASMLLEDDEIHANVNDEDEYLVNVGWRYNPQLQLWMHRDEWEDEDIKFEDWTISYYLTTQAVQAGRVQADAEDTNSSQEAGTGSGNGKIQNSLPIY